MYQDFFIPADGRSLLIADVEFVTDRLEDDDGWDDAVANGELFPFALSTKFPLGLRARVGALTEPEEAGWLGRVRWKLSAPSGRIVIANGLHDLFDAADDAYDGNSIGIEEGEYAATLYTMVTSFNAPYCLMQADDVDWDEQQRFGDWWRKTRPKQDFPDWLSALCMIDPNNDPGHRKQWEELDPDEEDHLEALWEDRPWADYVLQLELLTDALEMPELDDGLLFETEVRRTERCPEAIELD